MRKQLPPVGAFLTIIAMAQGGSALSQDAGAFADVPTSSWAYNAAAELQRHAVITGWPADYFSGKRTLTRYEFAIALKRALDKLTYSGATIVDDSAGTTEPHITPELLAHVRELVDYFKTDLIALHSDLPQVNAHLAQLLQRVSHKDASASGMPDLLRPGRLDAGPLTASSTAGDLLRGSANPLTLPMPSVPPALLTSSFARSTALPPSIGQLNGIAAPFASGFAARQNATLGAQNTNINLALPLTRHSALGLSLYDTPVTDDLLSANAYRTQGYGTSFNVQPLSHFTVGAEASRNITERFSPDGSAPTVQDNNTYLLNLGYRSGSASAVIGYKLMDPSAGNGGNWVGSLLGLSPTSTVQGPFTRIAFRISDRLQSYVGGDYYGNTGFRTLDAGAGPTTNPTMLTGNVYRGTAGLRWSASRRLSLTADYEGVLYDISGAGSASGRRFQPIEQYITLGAGLNLSRNTILKLAYQIYNQQDGSGSGDSPLGQSTGSTSVFTTQLAVHF